MDTKIKNRIRETCNNCSSSHEVDDVCIPGALLGVSVLNRCSLTNDQAEKLLANLNVGMFWDDIGPIIDRIEDGYYNLEQE